MNMNQRTADSNIHACDVQSDEIRATLHELNPVGIKPHATVSREGHGVQPRQSQTTPVTRLRHFHKESRHE